MCYAGYISHYCANKDLLPSLAYEQPTLAFIGEVDFVITFQLSHEIKVNFLPACIVLRLLDQFLSATRVLSEFFTACMKYR